MRGTISNYLIIAALCMGSFASTFNNNLSIAQAKDLGGKVGDGTAGSCTEQAFTNALAGGGTITFDCGSNPLTIVLTSQKTIAANTGIDGGGKITFSGGNANRLFVVNGGSTLTLNNLALINGLANGDGGAVFNSLNATLIVNNSSFLNNSTASGFSGGAIVSYGPLTITNSVFDGNAGGSGGAVYPRWTGGKTWILSSVLRNNYTTNTSNGWGGAMLIWDGASVEISDSEISNNTAREGGAIYVTQNSTLAVYASVLRGNTGTLYGGALLNNAATINVVDSDIENNSSVSTGAITNLGGALAITNTRIASNTATLDDARGGGIMNGQQLVGSITLIGDARIVSSTLEHNSAADGAGIYNDADLTLSNSTLYSNTARIRAGGIEISTGSVTMTQVTISGNDSATHGGGLYKQGGSLQANFVSVISNTDQTADDGDNLYFDLDQGNNASFSGSVVAYGTCGGDTVQSAGNNAESGNTCGFNQSSDKTDIDLLLDAVADNGGSDWTHLPLPSSPLIDAYSGNDCPAFDQRGYGRPAGAACDLGAVEVGGSNTGSTPIQRANAVDNFAIVNGRLIWLRRPDCSTHSAQSIVRTALNGGVPDREVLSQPNACDNSSLLVRSNIVADDDFVYWTTDQGVMRQSARANADDVPQVFFAGLTGTAELGIDPDFVIVIKNGDLHLIDKQTISDTPISDGNASKPSSSKGTTGHFVFWLSGTQLKRYNVDSAQTATIDGNAIAYKSVGPRQHCYQGSAAQCETSDFVFISHGNQVVALDHLSNKSDVVYNSDKLVYEIAFDGDTLITSEEQKNAGMLINSVVARPNIGLINSTLTLPKSVFTSPASAVRVVDGLKASAGRLAWRFRDRIDQIDIGGLFLTKPNVEITGMEVTQGVQTPGQTVFLVRGRDTWVRVFVKSSGLIPQPISGITARLKVWGYNYLGELQPLSPTPLILTGIGLGGIGGIRVPFVKTGRTITVQTNPDRSNLDHGFLFQIPRAWTNDNASGLLVFKVEVNPDRTTDELTFDDNSLMRGYTFYQSGRLQVQFVSWGYALPGSSTQIFPDQRKDIDETYSYIRRTYPLASSLGDSSNSSPGFRPGLWKVFDDGLGSRVDQSHIDCKDHSFTIFLPGYGLLTIPIKGDGNLCAARYSNRRMAELRTQRGLSNDIFMYGMISDNSGANWTRGEATGNSSTGPAGPPTNYAWDRDTTYGDWYAAHEIGHSVGRPHPFTGSLSDTMRTANCSPMGNYRWGLVDGSYDNGFPHPDAQIGANNDTQGFDPGGITDGYISLGWKYRVYQGTQWFDFMSYCSQQWISDYTTNAMYTRFRPSLNAQANRTAIAQPQAPLVGDWLLVQGDIQHNPEAAIVQTSKKLSAVGLMPALVAGNYAIQLLDQNGTVLANYAFTPDAADDATGEQPFTQVVTNVVGTRAIRIVQNPGAVTIGGKVLSDHAPTLSNVHLQNTSQPVANNATLSWIAGDVDNDPLSFDVFYSHDGGTTLKPLRLGVQGNSASFDTAQLGGGNVIFRVVATDGSFVVQANSASISMVMKPPAPTINTPTGLRVNAGETINFSGAAEDPQDGSLTGSALVWSNENGVMGVGESLPFGDLRMGTNVITLTATNAQALSASTAITVFVDDDLSLPGPTLSAAPDALAFGFAAQGSAAQQQVIDISNYGSGTLTWTATTTATWLALNISGGVAPGSLQVTANPALLPKGTSLNGTVLLQSVNDGVTQSLEIPVSVSVGERSPFGEAQGVLYLPVLSR